MATPQISVIMNVRNGAEHLREAIDSVIAQTFPDWELVVWDDCSTDATARIVAAYSDPRIRYLLSPEDTLLGRAHHLAMREARGDWLAFLDQDDVWLPVKLERQIALAGPGVGIVYGRTLKFSATGHEHDFDHRHEFEPLPEGDVFARLFACSCFIAMSSAMLRREDVERIGGVPDAYQVIPDYHLFVAIASERRARAVQEVVCRYRVHGGSMSTPSRRRMHVESLRLIDEWAQHLDPEVVRNRRRIHETVLALGELCHVRSAPSGLARLLARGSVGFLLSRPFARFYRNVRRRLRRPYWVGTPEGPAYPR